MFDGAGKIAELNRYIREDCGDTFFERTLDAVQTALADAFRGSDVSIPEAVVNDVKVSDTDWMLSLKVGNDAVCIFGDHDGPCNGYDPYIKTNIFDMSEEKPYYLYIDDMMGQEDVASSELYIDLKRAEN